MCRAWSPGLTGALVAVHKAVLQLVLFQKFMDFLREKKTKSGRERVFMAGDMLIHMNNNDTFLTH